MNSQLFNDLLFALNTARYNKIPSSEIYKDLIGFYSYFLSEEIKKEEIIYFRKYKADYFYITLRNDIERILKNEESEDNGK